MDLKEKTKQEFKKGINKVDRLIADHGLGSGYLSKATRIQRKVNIALLLGAVTAIAGIFTWAFFNQGKK